MKDFIGYNTFLNEISKTIIDVGQISALSSYASELKTAVENLKLVTTDVLAQVKHQHIDLVFSNSVSYLNMFGHITIAWLWLKQGAIAHKAIENQPHSDDTKFYNGKIQAMKYFFNSELPLTYHWGNLVKNIDSVSYDTQPDWL